MMIVACSARGFFNVISIQKRKNQCTVTVPSIMMMRRLSFPGMSARPLNVSTIHHPPPSLPFTMMGSKSSSRKNLADEYVRSLLELVTTACLATRGFERIRDVTFYLMFRDVI